jgi:urate oxidase
MPTLTENHYGKTNVRLLKLVRHASHHDLYEWTVTLALTGDFAPCFLLGDNTGLLATDTMKNAVYALARTTAATTPEAFALELAHFLSARYPQLFTLRISIDARYWTRLKAQTPAGLIEHHPTAFLQRGPELFTTEVLLSPGTPGTPPAITSGVRGLVLLKTSHSAFAGFHRDELTTLPETHDRLLGTEATITWLYTSPPPEDFTAARKSTMDALLSTFANHDSLSVQQTLYAMAAAALAAEPTLAELTLTLPNRHNIPIDFTRFAPPFHHPNDNTIFVPQDEPSGHIHARIVR